MGIEDTKLEMLFIKNSERRKGLGKELLKQGIENYKENLTPNQIISSFFGGGINCKSL